MTERNGWEKRLEGFWDELKWLYFELYPGREDQFEALCGIIRQRSEERSADLKALDAKGWTRGGRTTRTGTRETTWSG